MRNAKFNSLLEEIHNYGINGETREIFLHGHFHDEDEDPSTDWRMCNKFIKNIRLLDDQQGNIIVHQNNSGGDWHQGMAIYDAIAQCKCYVIIVCHGSAMSMGSIIPQAADLRLMMPHCDFMVHDGYSDIGGGMTYRNAQTWAAFEKRATKIMMDIYIEACEGSVLFAGKTPKQIKHAIDHKLKTLHDYEQY